MKGYNKYSLEQKKYAVELVNLHGKSYQKAALETGIPEKNIKRWKDNGYEKKKNGGRKNKYPELETILDQWIERHTAENSGKEPANPLILE
jgi:transposase